MLDVVALLEAAGAGTAFDRLEDEVVEAVQVFLAQDAGVPEIVACMIMTPDDGESEPSQDEPDQDDDGDGRDGDDQGARPV